jgi:hypothetical protein
MILKQKSLLIGGVEKWPYEVVGVASKAIPHTLAQNRETKSVIQVILNVYIGVTYPTAP